MPVAMDGKEIYFEILKITEFYNIIDLRLVNKGKSLSFGGGMMPNAKKRAKIN